MMTCVGMNNKASQFLGPHNLSDRKFGMKTNGLGKFRNSVANKD